MTYLIGIDPGHGGRDPGARYGDSQEKVLSLDIALKLSSYLLAAGMEVILTRDGDSYISLRERVELANKKRVHFFLSIHLNAHSNPEAKGIETLYYPTSLSGRDLARRVQNSLINNLMMTDRGIKGRSNLFVLKKAIMPAVLVECGFITNTYDRGLLTREDYRDKIAQSILTGLINYIKKRGD